jgi:hypothetical protein
LRICEELGEAALGFPAWVEPRWLDVGRRRIRGAHRKDWAADFSDVGRRATIMLQSRAQASMYPPLCTRGDSLACFAVRRALEDAGVDFIDANGGGPGVRLRENKS